MKPFLDRAQELVKAVINEHANYNTARLHVDRSRPVRERSSEKN